MRLFPTKYVLLDVVLCYIDKNDITRATQYCTHWMPESNLQYDILTQIKQLHKPDKSIPEDWRPVVESVCVSKTKWRWI